MEQHYSNIGLAIKINEQCIIEQILDNPDGLNIHIVGLSTGLKWVIRFSHAYSFLCANESYRLKTQQSFTKQIPGLVSKVENSTFLNWFNYESQGIYESDNLIHYMVYTGEEFVDVISNLPPVIELITEKIYL